MVELIRGMLSEGCLWLAVMDMLAAVMSLKISWGVEDSFLEYFRWMAFMWSLELSEETWITGLKLGSFLVIVNAQETSLVFSRKVLDLRVLEGESFGEVLVWMDFFLDDLGGGVGDLGGGGGDGGGSGGHILG